MYYGKYYCTQAWSRGKYSTCLRLMLYISLLTTPLFNISHSALAVVL